VVGKVDVLEGDFTSFSEAQRSCVGLVLTTKWSTNGRNVSPIVLPPLVQDFPPRAYTESPCQGDSASFLGISYRGSLMAARVGRGVGSP
jgi:hypothetical protein